MLNLPHSADIGKNTVWGISDFQISVKSLINENCDNYRTSHDTDMKFGPVTKFDKKNTAR